MVYEIEAAIGYRTLFVDGLETYSDSHKGCLVILVDLLRGTAGETIGEDDDGCSDSVAVYIGGDESWDVSKSLIGHEEDIGQDLGAGE